MSGWSVRISGGGRDVMPNEIRPLLRQAEGPTESALLCVRAAADAGEGAWDSDTPLYAAIGVSNDPRIAALVFRTLDRFLEELDREEAGQVRLIFVNFESRATTPPPFAEDVPTLRRGLQRFCQVVAGSVDRTGDWADCQWAMLTCTRGTPG